MTTQMYSEMLEVNDGIKRKGEGKQVFGGMRSRSTTRESASEGKIEKSKHVRHNTLSAPLKAFVVTAACKGKYAHLFLGCHRSTPRMGYFSVLNSHECIAESLCERTNLCIWVAGIKRDLVVNTFIRNTFHW